MREFSSPVHPVPATLMCVAMGVCWKTPMSPEEFSGKEVSTDWFASEEMCWKLTSDATAIEGAKHRQRLAIGQDADIA